MGLVIIGLNGYPQSGKDTFVQFCKRHGLEGIRIYHISSVTPVKSALKKLGWQGEKDDDSRDLMSLLKQWSIRKYDGPFNYIQKCYESLKNDEKRFRLVVLFVDCREPSELVKLRDRLGALTVFIDRGVPESLPDNKSDRLVENYNYDFVIPNLSTLEDLSNRAKLFVTYLLKERGRN